VTGEPLGSFEALSRALGSAGLIVALALTVLLQRLQAKLVLAEGRVWWASNGRDLINALSLGAIAFTLFAIGFPGPSALLIGATVLLVLNLFESVLLKKLSPTRNAAGSLVITLVLLSPVLAAPEQVNALLNALAARLFLL
jgi:hypothetical protein